jgi:hypothetical protein
LEEVAKLNRRKAKLLNQISSTKQIPTQIPTNERAA